jgi:hypothetical protein
MMNREERLLEAEEETRLLVQTELKRLLEQWGVPTVACEVAGSSGEAVSLACSIGVMAE